MKTACAYDSRCKNAQHCSGCDHCDETTRVYPLRFANGRSKSISWCADCASIERPTATAAQR